MWEAFSNKGEVSEREEEEEEGARQRKSSANVFVGNVLKVPLCMNRFHFKKFFRAFHFLFLFKWEFHGPSTRESARIPVVRFADFLFKS